MTSTQPQRRISEIQVTIADAAALELVQPEQMLAYLDRHGYTERSERASRAHDGELIGVDEELPLLPAKEQST